MSGRLVSASMLTIFVCSGKNFEEFFPDCNRLSFMADFLLALHCVSCRFEAAGETHVWEFGIVGKEGEHLLHPEPAAISLKIK